ncbi:MAG: 3-phosphoshikimate 1-carboxyvinyltransferase [Anaerolineae bacterium]|nr:3-phosphoshikimate 1-carboxyvinyltransferase [Anaerolineae bacterium]MDW8067683.1 3-phosphoshikimate 1-carboxyvinyltransferase [Anaerolineae bacterium]
MKQLVIRPGEALRGDVVVPGDKSISHRALLLSALAPGPTRIRGWLPAEDCQATLRCVRALGVPVEEETQFQERPPGSATDLRVQGVGMHGLREPDNVLDCGGSGTTMRLLAGILAGQPFTSLLTGNASLRRRPMDRVAEPLRRMGATVLAREGGRLPPLAIRGGHLRGIYYPLPVASAQVKSAILLAGLFAEGETIVVEPGPTRDHTERMLRAFGVRVERDGSTLHLAGGQALQEVEGGELEVPADISSAAFLLVAAAIVPGSEVRVRGVGINPTRTGLLDLLAAMGAELEVMTPGQEAVGSQRWDARDPASLSRIGEPIADLRVRPGPLRGLEVAGDLVVRTIDEFPVFAVAATQAEGMTTIREAAELRVKESDRIAAVAAELTRMGAQVQELPDGLIIHGPTPLVGTEVNSHGDHRLAMALAVAGLVARGETVVRNAEVIHDSFPGFVETMQALGADIQWQEQP